MARANLDRFAFSPTGEIVTKTYRIPFRPEYILVPKDETSHGPEDYVPLAQSSGFLRRFRFHLSEEAIKLIMEQDANVTPEGGYCGISIGFDSSQSGILMMEVSRGVRQHEVKAPETDEHAETQSVPV